jgi:ParB family transcriptional regulator, chromosome partitioning protein
MAKKRVVEGKRFDGYYMSPDDIKIVGLDPETPASDDLSHLYDPRIEAPVDQNMVNSIMVYGVTEPVIVTKRPDYDYAIAVDGRSRIRAARVVKQNTGDDIRVPVILRRGEDADLFGVMITSNEIRRDDTPLVKAGKVQRYINSMHRSTKEAAVTFGVSEAAIANWLKLLELAKPVQKLVEEGKLSADAASKFHGLSSREQTERAIKLLGEAKATGTKPTGKNAKAAASGKPVAPGKRTVQKILMVNSESEAKVEIKPVAQHDNFFSALRYMLGELSAEEIGLNVEQIETEAQRLQKEAAAKKAAEKKQQREAEKAARAAQQTMAFAEATATRETEAAIAKKESAEAMKRGEMIPAKKRNAKTEAA